MSDSHTMEIDEKVASENGVPDPIVDTLAAQPTTQLAPNSIASTTSTTDDKSTVNTVPSEDIVPPASAETSVAAAAPETADPRSQFDFSDRKVLVHNVTKFFNPKRMKKTIDGWTGDMQKKTGVAVVVEKVKKPPNEHYCIVTLKDVATVQPFIAYINDTAEIRSKKGEKTTARLADDDSGATSGKRGRGDRDGDDAGPTKRQRIESSIQNARRPMTEDEIRDKIIPFWRLSPEEQRDKKMKDIIKNCAMKITKEIKARFRTLKKDRNRKESDKEYSWIQNSRSIQINDIVLAPTPLRNKCEFTFGHRYLFDTNTTEEEKGGEGDKADTAEPKKYKSVPSVGFMTTGWAGGVSLPHGCPNISEEVCALVDIMNNFLLESKLPPYDNKSNVGFWRTLTVRSSRRTLECMIIIQHSPMTGGTSDDSEKVDFSEQFKKEKMQLVDLLKGAELKVTGQESVTVTSIFFQEFEGVSSAPPPEHPVQHAYGKVALQEKLGKCTFQISPGAFFQVNTEGAELLYALAVEKVREVSEDPEKTILFDVCCGTGTIGLTCMKEGAVGNVVGVDISEPAIDDAKRNAEMNGYAKEEGAPSKTRFVAARAEEVLYREIKSASRKTGMKFVAVVDPAREGLHADVVRCLRGAEDISRVVYVSCNPTKTLVRDAALFCAPPTKRYVGRPFKISSATPVDMFPLTSHCEMVMTFDRMKDSDL